MSPDVGPDVGTADEHTLVETLTGELPVWLPLQRWFAGKDQPVLAARPRRVVTLTDGDPALVHVLLDVEQPDRRDTYQLLVGSRTEPPEYLHGIWVGQNGRHWYEATVDPELATHLLDAIASERTVGPVAFRREPGIELETGLRGRMGQAEQSNTSLIFGHQYILKLFRRLTPGPNPDLELHRALHSVGCEHIAEPLGWIEDTEGDRPTLGMLQQFLPDAVEGWAMATTSVRDLMAEADLHADEVGGDFAAEAHRLGAAVAAVHVDLARALGSRRATGDDLNSAVDGMLRRLDWTLSVVPELGEHAEALRDAFERAREVRADLTIQHIHGDLHLGQVLRTVSGWLLIDFEGEPAAPAGERNAPRSPLRDVAGMLRSFDYAAHQMLIGHAEEDRRLDARALEWARRNRTAFCDGYAEVSPEGDPRAHPALLRAMELDKAVYEVGYEHANRPEWLSVPLASIARIAGETP